MHKYCDGKESDRKAKRLKSKMNDMKRPRAQGNGDGHTNESGAQMEK